MTAGGAIFVQREVTIPVDIGILFLHLAVGVNMCTVVPILAISCSLRNHVWLIIIFLDLLTLLTRLTHNYRA